MSDAAADGDLERVCAWFAELAQRVQAVDFAGARHLFAEDMVAFGTFSDFVAGREAVERLQWQKVWPVIADFRWRLAEIKALVAADRLSATGLACFELDRLQPRGRALRAAGPRHRRLPALRHRHAMAGAAHAHVPLPRGAASSRSGGSAEGGETVKSKSPLTKIRFPYISLTIIV